MGLGSFTKRLKATVRSLSLLAMLTDSQAAQAMDREAFIKAGLCEFMIRLWAIHEHASPTNRFLVVAVRGHAQSYVQCLLMDGDTQILCEVGSGVSGPRRRLELAPDRVQILAQAGFVQGGAAGNFQRMTAAGDDLESELVSTSMLMAELLYDIFGVRHPLDLEFKAPLARQFGPYALACLMIAEAEKARTPSRS